MSYSKNSILAQTICKIEIVKQVDILSILTLLGVSTVTLKTGKSWQNFYFTPATAQLTDDSDIVEVKKYVLTFFYPGINTDNDFTFESDTRSKWLIKITCNDNQIYLIGNKTIGATFTDKFSSAEPGQNIKMLCETTFPLRKI